MITAVFGDWFGDTIPITNCVQQSLIEHLPWHLFTYILKTAGKEFPLCF